MGAGWYGFSREPEQIPERIATLERLLGERGRNREDVFVSICPYLLGADADKAKRYVDAGVDQLIVMAFAPTPDALVQALDGLAETILEPVR
jgi:hypothetical protein